MFAQLCADLPWTQHLSEVWRMRDPEERAASLALRDGGPASVRRAIDWYRTHDRLHCGDPIAMAADALAAYQADSAAGKDALLICDTTEMADALNQRIHHDTIDADAPTVTGARGQRIGVGDIIISRRNDPTIDVRDAADQRAADSIRSATATDGASPRSTRPQSGCRRTPRRRRPRRLRRRLPARAHHLGYAVTVHSAQGVTADTSHAVLGENTTRALLYVAMTRGRHTNTAYLYQRSTDDAEYGHHEPDGTHLTYRGDSWRRRQFDPRHPGQLKTNHAITAHDYAAQPPAQPLPDACAHVLDRRRTAVDRRRATYETWSTEARTRAQSLSRARERVHQQGSAPQPRQRNRALTQEGNQLQSPPA